MFFDDFFDQYDRRIKKFFDEFADFDVFDKEFEENLNKDSKGKNVYTSFSSRKVVNGIDGKNYSMSYRYNSDMDEPEITIKGDATEEDINEFLNGIKEGFGKNLIDKEPKKLLLDDKTTKTKKKVRIPRSEKTKKDDKVEITFEMPGVKKEDVDVNINGKIIEVKGESKTTIYKKKIKLENKPKDIKIEAENGIVTLKIE